MAITKLRILLDRTRRNLYLAGYDEQYITRYLDKLFDNIFCIKVNI